MCAANVKPKKCPVLDSLVDFGPEDLPALVAHENEATRRLRNIVKQMDTLNRRVDALLNRR